MSRLLKFVSLWMILASLLFVVGGRPVPRGTNAERMARGLPPAPPVFRRTVPGSPTPVYAAKRGGASPSPTPPKPYSGKIEVRTPNGYVFGPLQNTKTGIGSVDLNGSGQDLAVQLVQTSAPGPLYDIQVTNALFSGPQFVGAAGNSKLGTGLKAISPLAAVVESSPLTPPTAGGQSAMWTIDSSTKQLTANYINPDGSKPAITVAFDAVSNEIFCTGDLSAYNSQASVAASEVQLYLV